MTVLSALITHLITQWSLYGFWNCKVRGWSSGLGRTDRNPGGESKDVGVVKEYGGYRECKNRKPKGAVEIYTILARG